MMNSIGSRIGILFSVVCTASCGFFGMDSQKRLTPDEGKIEIIKVSDLTGIVFPETAFVTSMEDLGSRDRNLQYMSWGIYSSEEIEMPKKSGSNGEYYLKLPLGGGTQESVQLRMKNMPIRGAMAALGSDWTTNGYVFTGTLIRADSGDHLFLMRTRDEVSGNQRR